MRRTLLILTITIGFFLPAWAQTPTAHFDQKAAVGQAFTMTLPQMAGASACTVSASGPAQAQTKDFSFSGTTLSGTPSNPGLYPLKIHCAWKSGRGATQLVMIRVAGKKK